MFALTQTCRCHDGSGILVITHKHLLHMVLFFHACHEDILDSDRGMDTFECSVAQTGPIGVNLRLESERIQVTGVVPGSMAHQGGIRPGDTLLGCNGIFVANLGAFQDLVSQQRPCVLTVGRQA